MTSIPTAIMEGIAADRGWNIKPDVRIIEVHNVHSYCIPLGYRGDKPVDELIQLEHFRMDNGEQLYLGYGPRSNTLIFRPAPPLTTPPDCGMMDVSQESDKRE